MGTRATFTAFTDQEQRCISAKIEKLQAEGKPREQAIAIAIKVCAPEKANAIKSAAALDPGPYLVSADELNGAPVFRIRGLPIFASAVREAGDREINIDLGWLSAAAVLASDRKESNVLSPIHREHQDPHDTASRERLGYFVDPRIGPALLDKQPAWVTI